MFLAGSRERSSKDGMSVGSLVDYESQRIMKIVLSTTVDMISMLRKEACPGSTHDLAHIPTPNCLADCLTTASAKADKLITAVQAGRLLDDHPDFRTLMEHKLQNIFAHKGEGSLHPEYSQDLSGTKLPKKDHFR